MDLAYLPITSSGFLGVNLQTKCASQMECLGHPDPQQWQAMTSYDYDNLVVLVSHANNLDKSQAVWNITHDMESVCVAH